MIRITRIFIDQSLLYNGMENLKGVMEFLFVILKILSKVGF